MEQDVGPAQPTDLDGHPRLDEEPAEGLVEAHGVALQADGPREAGVSELADLVGRDVSGSDGVDALGELETGLLARVRGQEARVGVC